MKRRGLAAVLVLILCLMTGCGAGKEEEQTTAYKTFTRSDYMGLDVEIRQDKNEYTAEDQIRLTLDIVNDTGLYLSDLVIKSDYSNALMITGGSKKIKADPMNVGESQNYTVVLGKAPVHKRVLNVLASGASAVGSWLWQFMKTHLIFDLIAAGCIALAILIAVIVRKVTNARLKKQGIDPVAYRKQKKYEKKAAKKEKKRQRKAARKEERRQKRVDRKLKKSAARQATKELKKGVKVSGDETKKLMALLLCGALMAECIGGGVKVSAVGGISGGDTEMMYSSDDYSMEVSHSFYIDGKEYTYTVSLSFTLSLIMTEGDVLEDPYSEIVTETLWPKAQVTEYSWKDSAVSEVSVLCQTENGMGELLISDCSGESRMLKTPGIIGNPVDITLLGDRMTEAVITFSYDPAELGEIDETKLGIVWYDESNDTMVLMEGSQVDAEAHTVSLRTEHFSKYAVVDTDSWYEAWEKAQYVARGGTADFPEFFNIVLAIDCSGSMQGENNEMSKAAAYQFITNLEDNDMFTVLKFASEAAEVIAPTYNGDSGMDVYDAIYGIEADGGTDFDNGLKACLSALSAMETTRTYKPYYAGNSFVNGTVTDENGNPLEGVVITFYVQEEPDYNDLTSLLEPEEADHQMTTDESGSFSIECSSSCYLKITYEKDGYETASQMITTSRDKDVDGSVVLHPEGYRDYTPSFGEQDNGLYTVEKLIVFLSDGQSSVSSQTYEALADSGCKVITIGLGNGVSSSVLQQIADSTGGVYIYTNNPSELDTIYEIIWGTYIGVSPEDNDGDGIPDAVEKAGMKNQYGEMVHPNPDYADTDGDGYSDSAEMGYFNDESGVFEMISDPTVPSRYVSDAKLKFTSSGNVRLAGSGSIDKIVQEMGGKFTVNIGLSAVKLEYPEKVLDDGTVLYDYLSETVYSDPTGTEMWVTWSDDCLSASVEKFSSFNFSSGGSVSKAFTFTCSKGGVTCKHDHVIEIHAKASNADEVVIKVKAQEQVRTQWMNKTQTWMNEAEKDVKTEGTAVIQEFVNCADKELEESKGKVADQIQFTSSPGNDALAEAVKQWMEDDYLAFVDSGYESAKKKTDYDDSSAAKFVKSIAKKIDGTNTTAKVTANGRTYTFEVNRTSAYGVVQWMFVGSGGTYYGVTKDMDSAVKQYLNDLKKLGDSSLDDCRKSLNALSLTVDTLNLTVLDQLFDTMNRKDCVSLLEYFGLGEKFYRARTVFEYFHSAWETHLKCVKKGTDNLDVEDITDLAEAIAKYVTFVTKQ